MNPISEYKPAEDKRPNGSRRITRTTCVALNALAEEVCGESSEAAYPLPLISKL